MVSSLVVRTHFAQKVSHSEMNLRPGSSTVRIFLQFLNRDIVVTFLSRKTLC